MIFNSFSFLIFFPIVFLIYWYLGKKSLMYQNYFLLFASYFFYSYWDYRFTFLLLFSTLLDYVSGIKIQNSKTEKLKNFWFWMSILINIGFLGVFKYFNFFVESFTDLLNSIGLQVNPFTINVILPIGISFYTFHGLSYVIDIKKERIKAETNFVDYSLFVSFFPLLVAGPIERATHLLPQIKRERTFNYSKSVDGLKQILWGLFKKIVIADNCAYYVNEIFENYETFSSTTLVLGAVLFAFQIYGDFSGYSDIALGTARMMGFELLKNFNFPYFSRSIAEFWRRWHISLSSWFKDYLYIPLGGSQVNLWKKVRNTFIIFLVSGFWHGANWTFLVWGGLNALFILPSIFLKSNRNNLEIVATNKWLPSFIELFQMVRTFALVVLCWIFFRANSLEEAFDYILKIFNPNTLGTSMEFQKIIFLLIAFMISVEWFNRNNSYGFKEFPFADKKIVKLLLYYFLLVVLFLYAKKSDSFIYFQF